MRGLVIHASLEHRLGCNLPTVLEMKRKAVSSILLPPGNVARVVF